MAIKISRILLPIVFFLRLKISIMYKQRFENNKYLTQWRMYIYTRVDDVDRTDFFFSVYRQYIPLVIIIITIKTVVGYPFARCYQRLKLVMETIMFKAVEDHSRTAIKM